MAKMFKLIATGFLIVTLCGCAAVMCMVADASKAKKTFDISYSDSIDVVKGALKTTGVKFVSARIEQEVAEVKGRYVDERDVRIYIHKESDTQTLIAVRVGTSEAGKKDAEAILQAIADYADLTLKK